MHCTHCGFWELAEGDLVCCWCGASYLRYTVSLRPAELSTEDYPPPLELSVENHSPMGTLTLERIHVGPPWISLLSDQPFPQTVAPGAGHRFYLDVDTFAAGPQTEVPITVFASYTAEAQTSTLYLRHPGPPSP